MFSCDEMVPHGIATPSGNARGRVRNVSEAYFRPGSASTPAVEGTVTHNALRHLGATLASKREAMLKVRPFTGEGTISIASLLRRFELVALSNSWDEAEKASQLAITLEGSAMEILDNLDGEWTYDGL